MTLKTRFTGVFGSTVVLAVFRRQATQVTELFREN